MKDKDKKLNPIGNKALRNINQFKEHTKHTQVIALGKNIDIKIRLQETIYPDKEPVIGVDIRKFLQGKFPFKGGHQGILIPKDKFLDFLQKAIEFTVSVYGKEVFYSGESQPASTTLKQVDPITIAPQDQQVVKRIEPRPTIRKSDKSIEATNWDNLIKQNKEKKSTKK